jgi:L-methionine (R)-S-oxide reductase
MIDLRLPADQAKQKCVVRVPERRRLGAGVVQLGELLGAQPQRRGAWGANRCLVGVDGPGRIRTGRRLNLVGSATRFDVISQGTDRASLTDGVMADLRALLDAVSAVARGEGRRAERAIRIAGVIRYYGDFRWVGVYDVADGEVAILGYHGPSAPAYPRFSVDQGLTSAAVSTGRSVVVNDVASDPRYLTAFDSTRSEMIVPVVGPTTGSTDPAAQRVVGTIDIESELANAFDAPTVGWVEECARAARPLFLP